MGKKKKDEIETDNIFEDDDDDDDDGCCPDTHAKCFEIVLIVGFLFSLIALTVNMILNLWFFKFSTFLLIGQIVPMALNAISFIISIILRCWRSDNSVFKKNFSSSNSAACFLLVLVIINFLSAIADDVLFYFAYNSLHIEDELINNFNNDRARNELTEKLLKSEKWFNKIVDKYKEADNNYGFDDKEYEKKRSIILLLPWVVFNFNLFIQFLAIILDCILMGRIKLKNHFGFPKEDKNKSTKNKIIDNDDDIYEKKMSKNKKKRKKSNGTSKVSPESDITIMKKKKKSQIKKKKKSSSIKKKKY